MEVKAKKSLGQNFLHDEEVLLKIANSITTNKSDLIIEIGPGMGALTKYLQKKDTYLVCYEIDTRFKEFLSKYENTKTKIIYQDFLNSNILQGIKDINYENIYIIANIPYYITTPIIKHIINLPKLKAMSLLVQKEVAKRFSAKPSSKDYGSLTVYLNYYFDIDYLFEVKNTCFTPVPKVDSAVINFKTKENKPKVENETLFFEIVEASFKMKRKTLRNNLKSYNLEKITEVLIKYNLPLTSRAEELPLEAFIDIANNLNI